MRRLPPEWQDLVGVSGVPFVLSNGISGRVSRVRTMFTIFLAAFAGFTVVSWFIWAFWISGTPGKPELFAPTFHFWSVYRKGIEEARSRGRSPRTIRMFEWSYGTALLCFI